MLKIRSSVEIDRPISEVFDFVRDHDRSHTWQMGLHQVTHRPGEEPHLGTITEVRKVMGRQVTHTFEIVDFVPNRKISHKGPATSHEGSMERHFHFEPTDSGTRVTIEADIDTRGALRSGRAIMERLLQRELDADLLHLKDIMEAHEDLHTAIEVLPLHPRN